MVASCTIVPQSIVPWARIDRLGPLLPALPFGCRGLLFTFCRLAGPVAVLRRRSTTCCPQTRRTAMAISSPPFKHLSPPAEGDSITMRDGSLVVPSLPIVPFIEGDGTG